MIETFGTMDNHKYCQLATFRRDGTAVDTPVWFALDGERLYVKTEDPSGKVKRIRREPRVRVAPCTVRGKFLGAAVAGRARILAGPEIDRAEEALRRRYGFGRRLFSVLVEPLFRLSGKREVYLEVVPAPERSSETGIA